MGDNSDLLLELDGFTVISNSPLSLFRDGDTVTIRSKLHRPSLPTAHGNQAENGKRPCPEPTLALSAAGEQTGLHFSQTSMFVDALHACCSQLTI